MDLIVKRNIIKCDVLELVNRLNVESGYKYFNIPPKVTHNNVQVQCPFHANGQEKKPSASIYTLDNDPVVTQYTFHCFACGTKLSLPRLVAMVLDITLDEARDWLIENYSVGLQIEIAGITLDDSIDLNILTPRIEKAFIDESILNDYTVGAEYLDKRGISREIQERFQCGQRDRWVGFPIRDYLGRLLGVTERNVDTKIFHIPKGMDKTVYLFDYIIKHNIRRVFVCESQINALTLWSWGYPAIALMGTGGYKQYDLMRKKGNVLQYVLCFDGDNAGYDGMKRFVKNFPDAWVQVKEIPWGKDVNDLTKEEFDALKCNDRSAYEL